MALALSDRFSARETLAQTISAIHGYVAHWTNGLHASLKPLLYGHQVGMETGVVEMAMHSLMKYNEAVYLTSSGPLDEASATAEAHLHMILEYKQEAMAQYTRLVLQTMLNLSGQSNDPLILTGRAMNQEEMMRLAVETKNRITIVLLYSYRMQLAYLFGDYVSALKYSEQSLDFGTKVCGGHVMMTRHFFYRGLSALALAITGREPRKNLRRALQATKMMKRWTMNGNVNCLHMVCLLEAEIAALRKENKAAVLYTEAVLSAGRACYLQDKALAHHRAGLFHLAADDDSYWAAYHFGNAIQCYHTWGASPLVDQLVKKYGDLVKDSGSSLNASQSLLVSNLLIAE